MKDGRIRLGHVMTRHDHSAAKLTCALSHPELFEVVGAVAEDPEREAELRDRPPYSSVRFMSRDELLERGVDAVLVESYDLDLVRDAFFWAEQGIHIHLDKPAGADAAEFERLLRTCKRTGAQLQMAYMYRYNPAYLDCLARIARGELGEIYSVTAIMNTCHDPEKRRWIGRLPGGIMLFLGCHMVDLIYRIMGVPDSITPISRKTRFDGVDCTDFSMALFGYPKGISVAEAVSVEVNGYGRRQLVVCGSEGTYEIRPLECPMEAYLTLKKDSKTYRDCSSKLEIPAQLSGSARYDALLYDFAAMVRGEKENPCSFDYELQLQKMILCCCGFDTDWKTTTHI
ncbi:MAG: Gfo/Idh/MocA family oxidoreductase [Clostridia bacterium]|jgi:predicted dehydrogenase|nr:Gfo/Idh/MocA family oxidoreductase [Clostridia bacterium]